MPNYTPALRALIFDMDGVIAETSQLHYSAWKRLADEYNIPFTHDTMKAVFGLTREASIRHIFASANRPLDDDALRDWMQRKGQYITEAIADLSPKDCFPGLRPLLQAAQAAQLKLAVASSSRAARQVIERLQLTTYFTIIGDGTCVVRSKPAPDIFLWVAGALGVSPAAAIVFEDSAAGVQGALAGGFFTVGIGQDAPTTAHLNIPDFTAITLDDLRQRFKQR